LFLPGDDCGKLLTARRWRQSLQYGFIAISQERMGPIAAGWYIGAANIAADAAKYFGEFA